MFFKNIKKGKYITIDEFDDGLDKVSCSSNQSH